jgi:hypothetical protein
VELGKLAVCPQLANPVLLFGVSYKVTYATSVISKFKKRTFCTSNLAVDFFTLTGI